MFILASASPRRRALLRQIGAQFVSITPAVAERKDGEHPRDDVIYNALTKARKVAEEYPDHAVLGADTTIVLGGNGTLVGASANLIVAGMAAERGVHISFVRYFKIGFPLMLLTIVLSTVYVYVRYLL